MDGVVSGEDGGFFRSEGQSDQSLAGNFEVGFALRCDLDNAAFSGERGGYVNIAIDIKRQALGTAQTAVENGNCAMRVDFVDAIEAGRARAGDEHIALGSEGDVIGGNAGLECGEYENLPVARDLENGSAAVADVKILLTIEGNAGGD